jgi:serine protease Do
MKSRAIRIATWMIVTFAVPAGAPKAGEAASPPPGALCSGAYADDFSALGAPARDFDRRPEAAFSYCTRNTADYECLSYGADGAVRRERRRAVLHGTAFAYKRQGGDTLLVTNDHVAAWPAVTDSQHVVDGVPPGCKKVFEALTLVDDEQDSYARDDVPAVRVVTDPELDVAILRAHADLQIMPWKIGHSAALRERNVIEVRGFPLGAFRATSVGKVISARDHDDEGEWNHDDFVVDALLSAGNSGSPVLAISCATGEYELVGIFHAGYVGGSALNVVVAVDQVRDLMTTLKRAAHDPQADAAPLDRTSRDRLDAALGASGELFFPFGGHVALARRRDDGHVFFAIYPKEFPLASEPALVVEDLPPAAASTFGEPGRLWFGSPRGLSVSEPSSLDAETQSLVLRILVALRTDATAHADYQRTLRGDVGSRQSSERARRAAQTLRRSSTSRTDLAQSVDEVAERLGPSTSDRGLTLAEVLATSPKVSPADHRIANAPSTRTPPSSPSPGPVSRSLD